MIYAKHLLIMGKRFNNFIIKKYNKKILVYTSIFYFVSVLILFFTIKLIQ